MSKKSNCKKLISIVKKIDIKAFPKHVFYIQNFCLMEKELVQVVLNLRKKAVRNKTWTMALEKEVSAVVDSSLLTAFNVANDVTHLRLY